MNNYRLNRRADLERFLRRLSTSAERTAPVEVVAAWLAHLSDGVAKEEGRQPCFSGHGFAHLRPSAL
jgi:hypothetical protein